ncbi:MAG: glycosyl hydrolase, partial [Lachnospiraceae bacterium]|nr:glycosyl hydrolase [Lachnospiraceae bacterium]
MGEKYNGLNQKGKTAVNNVVEKFCFQGDKTYNSAPFFWTDSGFGLYVDTYKETTFVFGEDTIEVHCDKETDLVLFSGS